MQNYSITILTWNTSPPSYIVIYLITYLLIIILDASSMHRLQTIIYY